mmetsp:Transcript_3217/g.19965  ORF Transcript_3217/g.19965 Transcript_3217/m.19965 type:complete len:220 (+) Transcript_3217:6366-7025(+)
MSMVHLHLIHSRENFPHLLSMEGKWTRGWRHGLFTSPSSRKQRWTTFGCARSMSAAFGSKGFQGVDVAHPTPMPRLVHDAVSIVSWERKLKVPAHGIFLQPSIRGGVLKVFRQSCERLRSNVQCIPCVMLAVSGRGRHKGTFGCGLATFPFDVKEDTFLVFDGPESGDGHEMDPFSLGSSLHVQERLGSIRSKLLRRSPRRFPDRHQIPFGRFFHLHVS